MDTFFDEAGPVEAIPRTDASSNPFRDAPDLLSFGASTGTREPSPSPSPSYQPPPDTLRSPTPSPDRVGAVRSAHRDAANEFHRDAAAVKQLGHRSIAAVRGGADEGVDDRLYYLDENERRELAFYREAARAQEDLRREERDRQPDGHGPQRIKAVAVRERADVSAALEILNLDPKAVITTGERKDIDKAGEMAKPVKELTAASSIEEIFTVVRKIGDVFGGVAGGVDFQHLVTIALCDPHEQESNNLLLHEHGGRKMLATLSTVVLPATFRTEILANAAASDQPFVLAAASAAAVVRGSPVLTAIDVAAARALRMHLDPSTRRAVAGAPTFVSCCDVLLDEKGNGWMARAKRVVEESGAPRCMVATPACSFVKVVNKVFADYMHRVNAPEQLGLTLEAAAALRALKSLPVPMTPEGATMLTDLRLRVEKESAKPGFGERQLRTALIPLLTQYGDQGLTPGQYRTQTLPVGVNAVVSQDATGGTKAQRKPYVNPQQKDKQLKQGAPTSEPARRLDYSTGQTPGQRQTGNRPSSPGGGQWSQHGQGPRQAPAALREAPQQDCDLGPDCPYLLGVKGPGWCRKNHSASEKHAAGRADHQRRDAGPRQDGRFNAPNSPRAGPQQQYRDGQQHQHGGQRQQRGQQSGRATNGAYLVGAVHAQKDNRPRLLLGPEPAIQPRFARRVHEAVGRTREELRGVTYVGDNGDRYKYTSSDLGKDIQRKLVYWSDQPVPTVHRTYAQAAKSSDQPQRVPTSGRGLATPAVSDAADVPDGRQTIIDMIDEFLATGRDFAGFEENLGFTIEAMREAFRSATPEQRAAHDGFRIPRGAMQVIGLDGQSTEVIVMIDTCAAEHMAHPGVPMTTTGTSDVLFQGATSRDLVAGENKGNLIVHTKNGPLPMFGVHQVAQIQHGVVIGSFYQFLKYYGQGLGLSLKKEMALFVPTAGRDGPRDRHSLAWNKGLLVVEGVLGVTAVDGTIWQSGQTAMVGTGAPMGRTVLAVNAVYSEHVAAPACVDVERTGPASSDVPHTDALHIEAETIRAVLAASLLDTVLTEDDNEVAPVASPPTASASASCSASCDAPTATAVGRGRPLRRQARPGRRRTSPTVSTKRARTEAVGNVNVCSATDNKSLPAHVLEVEVMIPSSLMPETREDIGSSVDLTPEHADTNVTVTDASVPGVLEIAAAPMLVDKQVTAAGAGAPVPYVPIGLAEQAIIYLLHPNGHGEWDRLNVSDVRCLYSVNRRMAGRIGCWPWNRPVSAPAMLASIPRRLFQSHYGWQPTGTFLYNPVHRVAMYDGINPAFQLVFNGGQAVYKNIPASMVALQAQFRVTQMSSASEIGVRCVACSSFDDEVDVDTVTRCEAAGCDNGLHRFCGQRGSAWSHEAGPFSSWRCASCVSSRTPAPQGVHELEDSDSDMPELVATSDSDDESTVRIEDSDDDSDLPQLVERDDGPLALARPIRQVCMVVSDFPDQRIEVQMAKGILDPKLHDVCPAVAHVVNCVELRPGGLAAGVQQALPYGDVYASRRPSQHDPTIAGFGAGRLGNIDVRAPVIRGQPIVVNMYAQWRGGAPRESSTNDTAAKRLGYFQRCLEAVAAHEPAIASIAFPVGVGCGLGGGDQQEYDMALRQFAGRHPEIRVLMVTWKDRSVLITNVVASLLACPGRPSPATGQGRQVHGAPGPSTGATVLVDTCAATHMSAPDVSGTFTGRSSRNEAWRPNPRQQAPACRYGDGCRELTSAQGCRFYHRTPPTITPTRRTADSSQGGRAESSRGGQQDQRNTTEAVAPRQQCDLGPQCRYLNSATGCQKRHSDADRAGAQPESRVKTQSTGPILPFINRLEDVRYVLGGHANSGPFELAGLAYLRRYEPRIRGGDVGDRALWVAMDWGAASFNGGAAVLTCPSALYFAFDLFHRDERRVRETLARYNTNGRIRMIYQQCIEGAVPTVEGIKADLRRAWDLPISAIRIVMGGPECDTMSSAPQGQGYLARRGGGPDWRPTSPKARRDDQARIAFMNLQEEIHRLSPDSVTCITENPRTGIFAQVPDVRSRLIFARGGEWKLFYGDHCRMSEVEWPQKPTQYAVLGPIVPFNIRCVPDNRCHHVNERGVHRLSIVDYNGNPGQVRVPDDDYLHRRSAIPVPAYGVLIALSLYAQDQFAEFRQVRHNMFQPSGPVPSQHSPTRIRTGGDRPERASQFSPGRSGTRESTQAPSRQSVPATTHVRILRFEDEPQRTMSSPGRRPGSSTSRSVEHNVYATASRMPLFVNPHPTALQLHAATAHPDVDRLLLSVRGWHGFAMTGANGKLIAAADIKRADLILDKICCTCMACKSNAVASHHTHHQRDAKRAAVAREAAGY